MVFIREIKRKRMEQTMNISRSTATSSATLKLGSDSEELVGGCCVCSDDQGFANNALVYCDGKGCTVACHTGKSKEK